VPLIASAVVAILILGAALFAKFHSGIGTAAPSPSRRAPTVSSEQSAPSDLGSVSGVVTASEVRIPFITPQSFTPSDVLGGAGSESVWAFGESASGPEVLYWSSSDSNPVTTAITGLPSAQRQTGDLYGLTTNSNGDLWVGFNQSLIEVSSASGELTVVAVPNPTDSAQSEAGLPTSVQGYHDVYALATLPDGAIVVASTLAASLEEFDPSTGAFNNIALPSSSDATVGTPGYEDDALAVASDGSITALLCQFESGSCLQGTDTFDSSGWVSNSLDSAGFGVIGNGRTALVLTDGRSGTSRPDTKDLVSIDESDAVLGTYLTSGEIITSDHLGLQVRSLTGRVTTLSLGYSRISPTEATADPPFSRTRHVGKNLNRLPLAPLALSADSKGNIWFIGQGLHRFIAMVSSRSL
jgi:hypothetical protein